MYLKSTFNPLFSEHLRIHILLWSISSHNTSFLTVSIGWNSEFALWRLVGGFINYECKEAYHLAFCKDDKFHFKN